MTEVFWLPEEAQDLGVGWERILFYWREMQPEGPNDWNTLHVREEWLTEADAQGRTVVGLIKNTAPWASTDGTEAGVPKGLYLAEDDPNNLWAGYVRRLAEYYGQRNVHHWIIWNEPEIASDVYGYEFAGSMADYYQMLKSAYKVIKESDPEAVIHLAGLTWWHDPTYLARLLALAAADPESSANGFFFDVISLHIYFRTETVRTIVEEVNTVQRRYGLEKPIWINETNAPPNRDPSWPVDRPSFNIDLEQQAWYIVQALALGFASGAERMAVYKLIDIHLPPGGESFGVVRPDYSRRPAYDAFRLATTCFGGFNDVSFQENPAYYQVLFERPGSLSHVAWSRTAAATTVQIAASTDSATIVTLEGTATEVLPENGTYSLQLAGQRCHGECFIGGEPLILVEEVGDGEHVNECGASQPEEGEAGEADIVVLQEEILESSSEEAARIAAGATPTLATVVTAAAVGSAAEKPAQPEGGPAEPEAVENNDAGSGDGVEISYDQRAMDDEGDSPVGLWFLGAGAVVAIGMAFVMRRHRTGQEQ